MKLPPLARFGIFRAGAPAAAARWELANQPRVRAAIDGLLARAERALSTEEETELGIALLLAMGVGSEAPGPRGEEP